MSPSRTSGRSDGPGDQPGPTRKRRVRRRADRPRRAPETPRESAEQAPEEPVEELPLLAEPADGVPPVVDTPEALADVAQALRAGTGPVAIDAERASGYRYSSRAYLIQVRREGSGTHLIDPTTTGPLDDVAAALDGVEWVLHAATQDIPCLAEVGLHPAALFDTELGARILGLKKVGLAAVVEHYLGVRLAKEHSAVDWSTRPLPQPWLLYAALDVEVLVEVRQRMAADLEAAGKAEWAAQEFAFLTEFTGPEKHLEPWRRTTGASRMRDRRKQAILRSLWHARDAIAQEIDRTPSRVLPDALLVDLAMKPATTTEGLAEAAREGARSSRKHSGASMRGAQHKGLTGYSEQWLAAIAEGQAVPEADLPGPPKRAGGPPPARAWADRDPDAAERLKTAREAIADLSEKVSVPPENLLTPEILRRVLWDLPAENAAAVARERLAGSEARPWQVDLVWPSVQLAVQGMD